MKIAYLFVALLSFVPIASAQPEKTLEISEVDEETDEEDHEQLEKDEGTEKPGPSEEDFKQVLKQLFDEDIEFDFDELEDDFVIVNPPKKDRDEQEHPRSPTLLSTFHSIRGPIGSLMFNPVHDIWKQVPKDYHLKLYSFKTPSKEASKENFGP